MNSYQPGSGDRYRVATPEQLDLGYEVASLGSRLMAALVDTFLITVLYVLMFLLGGFALAAAASFVAGLLESSGVPMESDLVGIAAFALIVLLSFGVFWGYYLFFEMVWHGQSPGKRWVGLRVIRDGGYPIGFAESAIRNLIRIVDFLPAYYGIGALVMFIDSRSRRLGDMAAGTLVVKERRDVRLESLAPRGYQPEDAGAGIVSGQPIPDLYLLTADDESLLREYLARRSTLTGAAASQLAGRLADSIARKLGHDLAGEPPEEFIERLARQLRTGR